MKLPPIDFHDLTTEQRIDYLRQSIGEIFVSLGVAAYHIREAMDCSDHGIDIRSVSRSVKDRSESITESITSAIAAAEEAQHNLGDLILASESVIEQL